MLKYILITLFVTLISISIPSLAMTSTGCGGTVKGIPSNSKLNITQDISINGNNAKIEITWIGDLLQCDFYDIVNIVYLYLQQMPAADNTELTAVAMAFKDSAFDNPEDVEVTVTRL